MEKWIEELKVGDKFAVDHGVFGKTEWYIHIVQRVTPKQISSTGGYTFWKKNGEQVGKDIWHTIRMEPVTEKIRNEVLKDHIKVMIKKTDFSKMSLGQLERIREAILDR